MAKPTWEFLGFIDDDIDKEIPEDAKILGGMDYLKLLNPKPYAVISIANAAVREKLAKKCEEMGVPFATLIHPRAKIKGHLCTIGEGSIICEDVFLAVNSHIGKHCILNVFVAIGHDSVIGDYVGMMPRTVTGGDIVVGKGCYFGLNCSVINQVKIVDNCTFGAGCVVVKDVTEAGTYVGVPAKCVKVLERLVIDEK